MKALLCMLLLCFSLGAGSAMAQSKYAKVSIQNSEPKKLEWVVLVWDSRGRDYHPEPFGYALRFEGYVFTKFENPEGLYQAEIPVTLQDGKLYRVSFERRMCADIVTASFWLKRKGGMMYFAVR
jgi:hypothetical protein